MTEPGLEGAEVLARVVSAEFMGWNEEVDGDGAPQEPRQNVKQEPQCFQSKFQWFSRGPPFPASP